MISPQVVGVLANMAVGAVSPSSSVNFVPGDAELKVVLTSDPNAWPIYIRNYINRDILPHWQNASLFPLIEKLMRKPSDLAGFIHKTPIDLPPRAFSKKLGRLVKISPDVDFLEYKLYGNKRQGMPGLDDDVHRGHSIVLDFVHYDILPTLSSQDAAVETIMDIRAFEGYLIRIAAAHHAAAVTNIPLPVVLALYRTEGDLVAPASVASLDNSLPPIEKKFRYKLGATHRPNLTTGVWLMSKWALKRKLSISQSEEPKMELVKIRALIDWFLIIIGFDLLEKFLLKYALLGNRVPAVYKTQFGRVSGLFWESRGFDGSRDAAKLRFQELLDNLVVTEIPASATVYRVIPIDPVKHIAMVLTEGLMFMFTGFRPGIPDELRYLHFHTQAEFSTDNANNDEFRKILISALSFAKTTNDPAYNMLKTSLQSINFPNKLTDYKLIEDDLINAGWNTNPVNWTKLAEFVSLADKDVWKYWFEHRANVSRYNILLDYYTKLSA